MFIVLEGIDGAGKGRQRKEISASLQLKYKNFVSVEFPDHQGIMYSQLIKPALLEKIKVDNKVLYLAFAIDQMLFQESIQKAKGDAKNYFVCDGYFTTNLVYNCLVNSVISIENALQFSQDFDITPADLNIFIDVNPKIALERKKKESGHELGLDINERDLAKQFKIREGYLKLVENNIFGKWEVVDGNGSIDEVKQEILKILIKYKYL